MPIEKPVQCRPIGVLLAAGRGHRMNGAKQFYPWPTAEGEKTLVAAAYDAISPVCDAMIVVLGHRAEEVADVLRPRRFLQVQSDPDAPMFESVRAGISAALSLYQDAPLLLHPGDHPEILLETLEKILAAADDDAERAILPEYQGQGGHPVLIPAKIGQHLLETDCPQGLRQYWEDHPQCCVRLPLDDHRVIQDIDSLAD